MGNRRIGLIVGIVPVLFALIAGVIILTKNGNNGAMQNINPSQTGNKNGGDAVATDKVAIQNFAYSPATVTVKVGTTVTWTNNDSVAHTVTADSGAGPDSGSLARGETYQFTYQTAGTFTYHCTPHPYMKGTVVVTN